MKQKLKLIDKFAEIDKKFAISSDALAKGIKRAGSITRDTGLIISKSIKNLI